MAMQQLEAQLGAADGHAPDFRFQGKYIHLTYKGHIDMQILSQLALDVVPNRIDGVKRISIVHELGSPTDMDGLDYEHTHMAIEWYERLNKTNSRFMDVEIPIDNEQMERIHPNISVKKHSLPWFHNLFFKYHRGHKKQKGGGYKITEPVLLWQCGIADWEVERQLMEDAVKAPTLIDACLVADIVPRTVGCLLHLRSAVKKRRCEQALGSCDRPWRTPPADWNRETESLLLVGPTNIGKTQFAKALFENAYVVRQLEDLKGIPQEATGLVFDDQEYAHLSLQEQKMIFDCRDETTIKMRFSNWQKPKLPAIFTCNSLDRLCNLDGDSGAIATRTYTWKIYDGEKMYE